MFARGQLRFRALAQFTRVPPNNGLQGDALPAARA
jgi:hypothetical protein